MLIAMNLIGWVATIMAILMYMPQVYKVVKHKSAKGISKLTFLLVSGGVTIWLIAAPIGQSWPGWAANAITAVLMLAILFYVFRDKLSHFFLVSAIIILVLIFSVVLWVLKYQTHFDAPKWTKIWFVSMAGIVVSSAMFPQLVKIIKTKQIGEFSITSSVLVVINGFLWVSYWVMKTLSDSHDDMIYNTIAVLASGFPLFMPATILFMNWKINK